MINEGIVLLAAAAAIISAMMGTMPRCPECGSSRTLPDSAHAGLRHCRRCLTVFQPGGR